MSSFLDILNQAAYLVQQAFPGSQFYEADGTPSAGSATDDAGMDIWRFVFLGPLQPGRMTTVFLNYRQGVFDRPLLSSDPFLGDFVIHLPIQMGLAKAIDLKNQAGDPGAFKTVTLRQPLNAGSTEPDYIFGPSAGGGYIFVGTQSGTVTRAKDAALARQPSTSQQQVQQRSDGDQIRLCTANGLVYKAFFRPYPFGGSVLSLVASGFYDLAPWELFFMGVNGNPGKFQLMEKVPKRFFFLTTFYTPCFCSTYGLEQLGDSVVIEDSFGEHRVPVERFGQ
jgi:hypothetical protein